eukprot:scaffold12174_cov121-Isochrysis_galbana.AAC.2
MSEMARLRRSMSGLRRPKTYEERSRYSARPAEPGARGTSAGAARVRDESPRASHMPAASVHVGSHTCTSSEDGELQNLQIRQTGAGEHEESGEQGVPELVIMPRDHAEDAVVSGRLEDGDH